MSKTVKNEFINSKKNTSETTNSSTFFEFQLAGPHNRITLSSYRNGRLFIFYQKIENFENFQKYHQDIDFLENLAGTAQLTLLEQMNSRLAPWFSFSLNLMAKNTDA